MLKLIFLILILLIFKEINLCCSTGRVKNGKETEKTGWNRKDFFKGILKKCTSYFCPNLKVEKGETQEIEWIDQYDQTLPFPWLALLSDSESNIYNPKCAAALIKVKDDQEESDILVTSKFCKLIGMKVAGLGIFYSAQEKSGISRITEIVPIVETVPLQCFIENNLDDGIVLVKLNRTVKFNEWIQGAQLTKEKMDKRKPGYTIGRTYNKPGPNGVETREWKNMPICPSDHTIEGGLPSNIVFNIERSPHDQFSTSFLWGTPMCQVESSGYTLHGIRIKYRISSQSNRLYDVFMRVDTCLKEDTQFQHKLKTLSSVWTEGNGR